jgi:hypothetical protein
MTQRYGAQCRLPPHGEVTDELTAVCWGREDDGQDDAT